jgi:hypothetical protein
LELTGESIIGFRRGRDGGAPYKRFSQRNQPVYEKLGRLVMAVVIARPMHNQKLAREGS